MRHFNLGVIFFGTGRWKIYKASVASHPCTFKAVLNFFYVFL